MLIGEHYDSRHNLAIVSRSQQSVARRGTSHRATSMNMSQHESPEPGPPARPFYDRVEHIRVSRGWTKVKLAQHLGVHRATIENWAKQPKPPLPSTIVPVASKLGIDRDEALRLAGILVGDERPPAAKPKVEVGGDFAERIERILSNPEALQRAEELLRSARIPEEEEDRERRRGAG